MKRDPKEKAYNDYVKSVVNKKIFPLFFYRKCDKCGMEVKRETMYESSRKNEFLEGRTRYYYGCTSCFKSLENFEDYIKRNIIWSKEKFDNPFGYVIQKNCKNQLH